MTEPEIGEKVSITEAPLPLGRELFQGYFSGEITGPKIVSQCLAICDRAELGDAPLVAKGSAQLREDGSPYFIRDYLEFAETKGHDGAVAGILGFVASGNPPEDRIGAMQSLIDELVKIDDPGA